MPMRSINRALPLFFVMLVGLGGVQAQAQRVQVRRARPTNIDSTLVARFQLADTYLRGAQYDRAIALLEDLYATSPTTSVFYEKLKEAYENVKRYDDAIALVADRLAQETIGDPTMLLSDKARLFFLKGEDQTAYSLWDEALAGSSENQNAYRIIHTSMLQVRLFDKAIEVLEQGRRATGHPTLFQADLAYLYGLIGLHEQAMEEYLGLLAINERQLNYVRNRLSRSLEQEG
ncbi:MAG: tetratricopeptide repeat protein, partial [Rhodothermales bacterium]